VDSPRTSKLIKPRGGMMWGGGKRKFLYDDEAAREQELLNMSSFEG